MNQHAYFNYSKKERTGILVLVAILLITAIVPKFFKPGSEDLLIAASPATISTPRSSGAEIALPYKTLPRKPFFESDQNLKTGRHSRLKYDYGPGSKNRQALIEVNKADTADFISLPFIGSKLAARIVFFREKLGGFHSKRQLGEVYGIADSVYRIIEKRLICDSNAIRQLNINTAGNEVLKRHPYIRWKFASALVNFRQQHGKFNSLAELQRIRSIDSASLHKMMPYLTIR